MQVSHSITFIECLVHDVWVGIGDNDAKCRSQLMCHLAQNQPPSSWVSDRNFFIFAYNNALIRVSSTGPLYLGDTTLSSTKLCRRKLRCSFDFE